MSRNIVIGIDVGTSIIKIVIAESRPASPAGGQSNELHILAAVQKTSSGLRHGYVIDSNAVTDAISKTIKETEHISALTIKHAYLSIGGVKLEAAKSKGIIVVSRADNEVTEADIKRAIAQAESNLTPIVNRSIIHTIPLYYKIDGEMVLGQPAGMKGEKLEAEVLFVTSLNQHLSALVKSVETAGINVDDVYAAPVAASYAVLDKHQKEVGVVLVDIGAETTSMAVFEEGSLLSLAVFPFGSTHITNDIALGLKISLEEAEQLKFNYVSDNQKRKLTEIIEARLDDIFELVGNHLRKIGRNELLPAGVVLIGGGANLIEIENFAKSSLKLPVKIGSPVIPIKAHDKQIQNPKWATALGLCVFSPEEKIRSAIKLPSINPILRWLKSFLP